MPISRRDFLMRVGQAGGYTAAFTTMQSLGLIPMKPVLAQAINAPANVGKGTKVVVLGGGIGGLVSAYELRKHGYDVTLLEARERPGGRNFTGRKGTKVEFIDGTVQTIAWEEGNYQNLGPARLPSTHVTMLGYARELGVALEVEINTTRSSLLQNDKANGGKTVRQRKAINDTRGHVSELLNKCIQKGALDADVSVEDRTRMADFLTIYGPLDKSGAYVGSERAGIKTYPGAGRQVEVDELPMDMHTLLDADFWNGMLYEEVSDWQATMMQPVCGMDRIPYAFAKSLGSIIQYGSPVTEIRKTSSGVKISYTQGGHPKQIEATYCICALPFSMLKKIPNDLSRALQSGHRRQHHGRVLQDSLGSPSLLGDRLQHLRWPLLPCPGPKPRLVPKREPHQGHRYRRLRLRGRAPDRRLQQPDHGTKVRPLPYLRREAPSWPRQGSPQPHLLRLEARQVE